LAGAPDGTGLASAFLRRWRINPILTIDDNVMMPHRKHVKHFHQTGHLHEFTFSTYRRMPLLTNDRWREKLARTLDAANEECRFQLVAFVFMPEHIHLLTNPVDEKPDLGLYLARIKQPFSQQIKNLLILNDSRLLGRLTVDDERPGKRCFRFWQEGPGYDRNVFSKEVIVGAINYIHENPLRRRLCRWAVDWKWTSTRYYLSEPPRQQDSELPFIHGLPSGAFE
jgi:putative transposase